MVARHLFIKWSTENKNKNLCQVGNLCQSQEFMPQVARGFVYYVFMFIKFKIDFYTEILFALDLTPLLIVRTSNLAIF